MRKEFFAWTISHIFFFVIYIQKCDITFQRREKNIAIENSIKRYFHLLLNQIKWKKWKLMVEIDESNAEKIMLASNSWIVFCPNYFLWFVISIMKIYQVCTCVCLSKFLLPNFVVTFSSFNATCAYNKWVFLWYSC